MLMPPRLVDEYLAAPGEDPEIKAVEVVAAWLARVFVYEPDPERTAEGLPPDRWPLRSTLETAFLANGRIVDDCDGWGFGAVYCLKDLGIRGRVVAGWTEPVFDALDGKVLPRYHMNAQSIAGWVTDNRYPGQVLTWDGDELKAYTPDKMAGYFEFGDVERWTFVRRAS